MNEADKNGDGEVYSIRIIVNFLDGLKGIQRAYVDISMI